MIVHPDVYKIVETCLNITLFRNITSLDHFYFECSISTSFQSKSQIRSIETHDPAPRVKNEKSQAVSLENSQTLSSNLNL